MNIEANITEWRRRMRTAGIQSPVPLEELEEHLREEMEQQLKSGKREAEAFKLAEQKIGAAPGMQAEFAKVMATSTVREEKFMLGMLVLAAIVLPAGMAGSVLFHRADMTAAQLLSSLAALGIFSSLSWFGRLGYRRFPVIGSKRTRDVIGGVAAGFTALWWIVFMRGIVPGHDYTMMQFVEVFTWAFFVPAGVMLGLVFGLDTAARKRDFCHERTQRADKQKGF